MGAAAVNAGCSHKERLLPTETVDTDAPVFETMGFAGVVAYFTGWTIHPNALYAAVKLRRTGHEPGLTPRERYWSSRIEGNYGTIVRMPPISTPYIPRPEGRGFTALS